MLVLGSLRQSMEGHIRSGRVGGSIHVNCIGSLSCNAPGWLHCFAICILCSCTAFPEQHVDVTAEPEDVGHCTTLYCDSIL